MSIFAIGSLHAILEFDLDLINFVSLLTSHLGVLAQVFSSWEICEQF